MRELVLRAKGCQACQAKASRPLSSELPYSSLSITFCHYMSTSMPWAA